jgi:DNA-binding MarR family transcriptional regulator
MPRVASQTAAATSRRPSAPGGRAAQLFPLLRNGYIFASAVREIVSEKLLREATTLPLTVSQFQLLKLMTLDGKHRVGELADLLGVTPPAVSKNIDKLEGLGLVVRAPSKGDRRATLLSVSPRGRRLVRKHAELVTARLGPVLEGFRRQELEQFWRLLERFSVSLLNLEASADGFCLRCAGYLKNDCPVGQVRGGCPYQKIRRVHPDETVSGRGK